MNKHLIDTADILLPNKQVDMETWSVIACDQFTSQPEYWEETEHIVSEAPSTLRLTLPEIYLNAKDAPQRIEQIHQTMQQYLNDGIFSPVQNGFVLVKRTIGKQSRLGLVAAVDLEDYAYTENTPCLIRPTEKTVVERIPPRLKVRENAALELPHIMLLIDDPSCSIIEPLFKDPSRFHPLYDTDLMQGGGHITGYFIPKGPDTEKIQSSFDNLLDENAFSQKYALSQKAPLLAFAVGDGNHSMATAKAHWETIKRTLSETEQRCHPARFALVEIVNIHDNSLIIEPIHRVLFSVEVAEVWNAARAFFAKAGGEFFLSHCPPTEPDILSYPYFSEQRAGWACIRGSKWNFPLAALQAFLDAYLAVHPAASIDYIHGADVTKSLAQQAGNLGFILPDISKNQLFKGVITDGVLPRKTFSMGHACEKRYYMEARKIIAS